MSATDLIVNFIGQDKSLSQTAQRAGKAVNEGLGRGIEVGAKIGTAALAGLGVAVAGTGVKLISLGSDAEEMLGKFNVVFAQTGGQVTQQLEEFGTAVGRSKFELMEMASTFGDTFKPMGFAEQAAADLSVQMTQLATDLGSFNNMEMDEALQRLQGTLIGNHENALAFGVIINENTLKAELAAQGWDRLTGAALEQAKVQARINLLMAGTTDAQGDAARTSGSWANQMRGLKATLTDIGTELGMELLPAVTPLLGMFKELALSIVPVLKSAFALLVPVIKFLVDHMDTLGPIIAAVVAGLGTFVIISTVVTWITGLIAAVSALSTAFIAAGGGIAGVVAILGGPVTLVIAAVAAIVALFTLAWTKNWFGIRDTVATVVTGLKLLWQDLTGGLRLVGAGFEWLKNQIVEKIQTSFRGLIDLVMSVIDWFKNLGETIKDLVLPDWLQRASPSPIEMTFSGLRGELKHLTREELPAFGTQMQGLNRISHDNRQTSIVNNITTSRVNVPGFNRTQAAFATGDL